MAKDKTAANGEAVDNTARRGLVIELSDATLASIAAAATKFGNFGLSKGKARALVAAKIEQLSAGISAVDLYAEELKATFAALDK